MEALKRRVVVVVDGGVVQAIFSNYSGIDAQVLDFDNLREENHTRQQLDDIYDSETKGLKRIF